jgi:hypothetical protein
MRPRRGVQIGEPGKDGLAVAAQQHTGVVTEWTGIPWPIERDERILEGGAAGDLQVRRVDQRGGLRVVVECREQLDEFDSVRHGERLAPSACPAVDVVEHGRL